MLLLGVKLCDFAVGSEVGSKDMIFLVKMGRRGFISDFEEMCCRVPGFVPGLPWANLLFCSLVLDVFLTIGCSRLPGLFPGWIGWKSWKIKDLYECLVKTLTNSDLLVCS